MERFTMRVQLDGEARQALIDLTERMGMTQVALMSRVLTWFADQNEVIQVKVLGGLSDDTVANLAKELLQRMAKGEADANGHRPPRDPAASEIKKTAGTQVHEAGVSAD